MTNALTRQSQVLVPPGLATYGTIVTNAEANDAGTVVFTGHDIFGCGNDHVEGLFTADKDGHVTLLATINNKNCDNGRTPSGKSCVWEGYRQTLAINSAGTVAATVTGIPGNGEGVALNGDTVNGRVAWPGQNINGCKISQAIAGGINSAGHIALWLFSIPISAGSIPAKNVRT